MQHGNWTLDPRKYLSRRDARRLLAAANEAVESASFPKQRYLAVRNEFVMHLGLSTGLRVAEIAMLNCGDLYLDNHQMFLLVRCGKGSKRRLVHLSCRFAERCKEFLIWKQKQGEPTEPESPLFLSSRTGSHLSCRILQAAFKRCAQLAGLSKHYSIHGLRHTYACFLYLASNKDLRMVQKQLGHSRITTTQVYADVMAPDIRRALNKLPF